MLQKVCFRTFRTLQLCSYGMAHYKYPFNFNNEEHKDYIRKVADAEKLIAQTQQQNMVPRRRRRVFDRPKHDLDITDYSAWRLFCPQLDTFYKFHPHGAPVLAKIQLQPKWVLHAFGQGNVPINHTVSADKQFVFEDNYLARFLLYEYRNTTLYRRNIPGYDYQNQQNIRPALRKIKRIDPEDFWKSEQYYEFRLNGTTYAEHLKFVKWLTLQIEIKKTQPSYDEFINKKFGPPCFYNKKEEADKFVPSEPIILKVGPSHFAPAKKNQIVKPPFVDLPQRLEEKYRIKEENKKKYIVKKVSRNSDNDQK